MDLRWAEWNMGRIAAYGVDPNEAEETFENVRSPFPRRIEDDKCLAWGPTSAGRLIQVIFVLDEDGTVFVIHARDLSASEKRRMRRR